MIRAVAVARLVGAVAAAGSAFACTQNTIDLLSGPAPAPAPAPCPPPGPDKPGPPVACGDGAPCPMMQRCDAPSGLCVAPACPADADMAMPSAGPDASAR